MLLTAGDDASTRTDQLVHEWWSAGAARQHGNHPAPDLDHVPLVGLDRLVTQVLETVGPKAGGVLITGETGSGKTVLLERLGRELERDMYAVQIRGSSIGARTEYGALRFLLDAVEGGEPNHPVLVYQRLSELLRVRAKGRPVVLLVDNAHLLDGLAALIIGLLVRGAQVRAVIACTGVKALSEDLAGLWKDRLLDLHDLQPFSLAETEAWMMAALNARVSRLAVRALWDHSAGNPLILKTLLAEQLAAGSLLREAGVYVLATASMVPGKTLSDVLGARVSRLTPEQRMVLELLALSGGLTPENLRAVAAPEAIGYLIEGGLAWSSPRGGMIHVKNPAVAEIIRHAVPPGRSTELRRLLESTLDLPSGAAAPFTGPSHSGAYASWHVSSGTRLHPELALVAAQEANRSGDAGSALRFLAQDPDRHLSHRAVLAEACALLQLRRQTEAEQVLKDVTENHVDRLPLAATAEFFLGRASLACIHKDAPAQSEGYLRELRERLSAASPEPAARHNLQDELALAEAAVASYQGHYAQSIPALTTLYVNGRGTGEELRLRAGGLLSEALAMIGRQEDAVRVAEGVSERIAFSGLAERLQAESSMRLLTVYLTAGMWNRCVDLLTSTTAAPGLPGAWLHGLGELGAGLIHAYAGRSDQALEALDPAIVQLRILHLEGALGVALAAAAYAHALQGDFQESRSCIRELEAQPEASGCMYRSHVRYFAALTEAVEAGPEAARNLLELADEEQAEGRTSNELFFLSAAVQTGEVTAAPRLLAAARRSQGVFAEACRLLATGLMAENPELILSAGELARGFGNERFCREAALAAHEVALRNTNRTTARRALNVAAESERKMRGQSPHQAALARLDVLTGRERDIVERAAAGASNKDIAQQLHLSVRTVEGHLYQSYTKLQISGRDLLHRVQHDAALASGEG